MIIKLGSVYKNTSLFYFYFVIKKKIKKHHLIHLEELYYDIDLGQEIPNELELGLNRTFTVLNGDVNVNGRIYSIGPVIWNQELHRLEYWDGTTWQHLIGRDIV